MGTSFTQSAASLLDITTPLGPNKLLLRGFRGSEGISRLFRFDLDLLSEDSNITYADIVGKNVTIAVKQASGTPRYFNGVISRFGQGAEDGGFTTYHAEMVPWLWLLTRSSNCRIFQNLAVSDILKQVFGALSSSVFSISITGASTKLEYCVQYRETDFNFVSRLMEEYGIYYFFQHDLGKHTMMVANDPSANVDCPGQSAFTFYTESTAALNADVVQTWEAEQELRTGQYSLTDYNFTTPSKNLLCSTQTLDAVGGNKSLVTYDYPGKYLTTSDGNPLVKTRMEEEESIHLVMHGTSDARSMVSGYKFTLSDHYRDDMNTSYLLTDIEHIATTPHGASAHDQQDHYSNSFKCIPASVTYRPLRLTPRPTIPGPQPALVVGASGDEICTDKYGRIKVQFFWDQLGKKNDNSSCWIRVSQVWAGKQWGVIFLPRVGQEVMVDFLEGDPDQPLVTGSVYNAEQMPPYTLPDNMTQSGILTRSSKGGTADNYNQIRFEDKKGSEEILIHAEKDMNRVVENNDTLTVTNDQTIEITKGNRTETIDEGNETVEIKKGNRSHTITNGNETLTVKTGNRVVEVSTGDDTHKVKTGNRLVEVTMGNDTHKIEAGDRQVTIDAGNDTLDIVAGNQTTNVDAGSISTTAMQSITLTVGQNSLTINQQGITINGTMIGITATATMSISSGADMSVNASGPLSLNGAMTSINGS